MRIGPLLPAPPPRDALDERGRARERATADAGERDADDAGVGRAAERRAGSRAGAPAISVLHGEWLGRGGGPRPGWGPVAAPGGEWGGAAGGDRRRAEALALYRAVEGAGRPAPARLDRMA